MKNSTFEVAFCTENMAKAMLFLPVEFAPGHLVDARDIQDAIRRMQSVSVRLDQIGKPHQLELFA